MLRMEDRWPELPWNAWRDTYATLHMYTQVIGKIRLGLTPKANQWWNVPFYLTPRGLTSSSMPYDTRTLEIDFDFVDHNLIFRTSEGQTRALALVPRSVAAFYHEVLAIMHSLDMDIQIRRIPCESPDQTPFDENTRNVSYDAEYVERFWQILRQIDTSLKGFRAGFRGKASPVHFFWGSFDLATSRFSGRMAPPRPGADSITRDAYDEEVSSVGFWPGDEKLGGPALYSYTVPAPPGFAESKVQPEQAYYSAEKKEFLLLYEDIRRSSHPEQMIWDFAQSTYEVGARLAGWDLESLAYLPSSKMKSAAA